jgi:hypothetical protein
MKIIGAMFLFYVTFKHILDIYTKGKKGLDCWSSKQICEDYLTTVAHMLRPIRAYLLCETERGSFRRPFKKLMLQSLEGHVRLGFGLCLENLRLLTCWLTILMEVVGCQVGDQPRCLETLGG